jgi:Domain of unknown function (DUF4402)
MNLRKMVLFPFVAVLALPAARAQTVCQLCSQQGPVIALPVRPLQIEIDASLDFSTAAHSNSGEGSIEIDPRTGQRRVTGGLVALGGMALKGTVRLKGDPFRRVRISLPASIEMVSTLGAKADITSLTADVSTDPVLGRDGTLTFSFGGRMTVRGGAAGDFHGRIPITADYQ